jgi:NlpC/P60 family protein/peptidase M23-like protein
MRYLGVRYVWAGASPKGFDCSGLTMYVYAQLGIRLPHYSGDQWRSGFRVSTSQLKPGDLVFFYGSKEPQHVGMYVGDGKFIHAPHRGDVVKISKLSGRYASAYVGAVRPYGLGPPIVFPVVGRTQYSNSFGSTHKGLLPGTDIIAPRKSLAVAAEAGRIKVWTRSKPGGCMLYLYGKSGTTYEYLHLNNDISSRNDNLGHCSAGTAYAPGLLSGQKVQAGQLLGFVGDSGVANGTQPHLHFEVHRGGRPVNPYPFLNRSQRPLFAVLPGPNFTLSLEGKVVTRTDSTLTFAISSLRAWPGGFRLSNVGRNVTVKVSSTADIELAATDLASASTVTTLLSAHKGQAVSVKTPPAAPTLPALLGRSGALQASQIVLGASP